MRIAVALHSGFGLHSIKQVSASLMQVLGQEHTLAILPSTYALASDAEQSRIAGELVASCDVIVGFHSMLMPLLRARSAVKRAIPCIVLVLGAMPRGAVTIRDLLPHLTMRDVFVVTSQGDAQLVKRFVANAKVALLALSYDEDTFRVLPSAEREQARAEFGCSSGSPMVLYAGRLTLEKNILTLLRAFRALAHSAPGARLILAGPIGDDPCRHFGIMPVNFARTIVRTIVSLGLEPEQVHYLPSVARERLCTLYNAADVVLNLTLNHDENFGLTQVEASACGTPCVGTAWGGLRDTIRDGVNGYLVSAVVTPLGVKVDWNEAVVKVQRVLRRVASAASWSREMISAEAERFSTARYVAGWRQLLSDITAPGDSASPLAPTTFATEFWRQCSGPIGPDATYVFGTASFDAYLDMIASYATVTADHIPLTVSLEPDQIISLPAELVPLGQGRLRVEDALYPVVCALPSSCEVACTSVTDLMVGHGAMAVEELLERCSAPTAQTIDAVQWMMSMGLLLRSRHAHHGGQHRCASRTSDASCKPTAFSRVQVDPENTDFLVYGRESTWTLDASRT